MFKPYVAAESKMTEFTLRAVILGILLGLVFGVGNAYLGLKVGTTVSASIPAAVISMTILRTFFRKPSILENNLVQTIASVGEGLAAGIIFTVPALFILGEEITITRMFLLAVLGGVLGVLFMIPMRRYIIVKEHGVLPFPEGTACAEILKSGEKSGPKAAMAFTGIITGALYKILSNGLNLWRETPSWTITSFQKTAFSIDVTPALLGVGYIVGPRIAGYLFTGGAMAWWVLIPLIKMFGVSMDNIFPGNMPVVQMSADDVWSNYIRYIGVGAIAVGGLVSLINIVPAVWKTVHSSIKELFEAASTTRLPRTDKDISLRWLLLGSVAIILTLWLLPGLPMNLMTILLLTILGFFFVAVTSLTVGIVGSTSNPVSGMTITTLLITCLIFVALGWTERLYLIAALTMSIVACVAICMAGTTSQDLKTGYILGATPRSQQIAEMIGAILPALAISGTVYLLHHTYGFGSSQLPAPQGTMMALLAQGVIEKNIPFTLVSIGAIIGLLLRILTIPILPVAVGLYLPLSLSTPVMLGGMVAAFIKHRTKDKEIHERGILSSSGLIAGDACMGVILALLTVAGWLNAEPHPLLPDIWSLIIFIGLALGLGWFTLRPPRRLMKTPQG
ncbi:MAG: oligopeptide transporter, OPT family [Verrucomicrobia bacterium]|nr:oligopeptide transporter, OPT family [Verrucomicrobiota bacterium]